MSARWQAVLYDWDGTIMNSAAATYTSYQKLFGAFGISFDRERFEATYAPDWYRTYRALGLDESEWRRADAMWLDFYRDLPRSAMPGAVEAVMSVADAGLVQGVVTSGDRRRVEREIQGLGLEHVFRTLVCAGEAKRSKPHPDPLLAALAEVRVQAGAAAYVGDSPEDVLMAKAAGVHVIGVPGGFPNLSALEASEPDRLLPHLGAAVDYLLSAC